VYHYSEKNIKHKQNSSSSAKKAFLGVSALRRPRACLFASVGLHSVQDASSGQKNPQWGPAAVAVGESRQPKADRVSVSMFCVFAVNKLLRVVKGKKNGANYY